MTVARRAFAICTFALGVAGCGAAVSPSTGAQAVMQQSAAEGDAGVQGDLLYISVGGSAVYVYTYPEGRLLGSLGSFDGADGMCSNAAGDVFIGDYFGGEVIEYPHGGTQPIATLNSTTFVEDCSVNPKNSELAVTTTSSEVVVFPYSKKYGWRFGKTYSDPGIGTEYCSYDPNGDLFVDGTGQDGSFVLTELPHGRSAFINIAVDQGIQAPGGVMWDGEHVAIGDADASPLVIYQFDVSGSTGTYVGSLTLDESSRTRQFWLQGSRVIAPESGSGGIGFWRYPQGGDPVKSISGETPAAITVSVGK